MAAGEPVFSSRGKKHPFRASPASLTGQATFWKREGCSPSPRRAQLDVVTRLRWPVILTDCINNIHDELANIDEEAQRQGKALINAISELKYQIAHDRQLAPLDEDGEGGIPIYNAQLSVLQESGEDTWFSGPWLYNECYLYRRLRSLFLRHPHWQAHDPFESSKTRSFQASGRAVFTLARSLEELIEGHLPHAKDESLRRATFMELMQTELWGNASGDLSLFAGLSSADIDALQNRNSKDQSSHIIHNDLNEAWAHLSSLQDATIAIVLDNAGFELFTDLVVADWLISCTPYCSRVVFHAKSIPWFVSDVMPKDFHALVKQLSDEHFFASSYTANQEERTALKKLVSRWQSNLARGAFRLAPTSEYWTGPSTFSTLSDEAPDLLKELQAAGLVVFKGDLNYRKLTGDLEWAHDTPFETALGQLQGKIDLLTLRTCKADVVVGLTRGRAEELQKQDPRWRWNGKWGIVAFSRRIVSGRGL